MATEIAARIYWLPIDLFSCSYSYNLDVPDILIDMGVLREARVPTLVLHGDQRIKRVFPSDPGKEDQQSQENYLVLIDA